MITVVRPDIRTRHNHERWIEWATRHGLDPNRIPYDATIEYDNQARTITTLYLKSNPDHAEFSPVYDRHADEWLTETVTRQLEAEPLPFPPGIPWSTRSDLLPDDLEASERP